MMPEADGPSRGGGLIGAEADPIRPVRIRHEVEADIEGDTVYAYYNYLIYDFEGEGVRAKARVYLDEPKKVSIFGPYRATEPHEEVNDPAFLDRIIGYLKRRYVRIQRFMKEAPEPYQTIWPRPDP